MTERFPVIQRGDPRPDRPSLVLMAGFPDDQMSAWHESFVSKLAEKYHLVMMCLPGYEVGGRAPLWGYNFEELLTMMHDTIQDCVGENTPFYLLGHDWGSYLVILYQNRFPNLVLKLTMLDVGLLTPWTVPITQLIRGSFYQLWFAISYFVSQRVNYVWGSRLLHVLSWPIFKFFWVSSEMGSLIPKNDHTLVAKCYPYYYLWREVLTGSMKFAKFPSCPLLYLYATHKNFMFHDDKFMKKIENRKDCRAQAVETGHWIALTAPDVSLKEVEQFLA